MTEKSYVSMEQNQCLICLQMFDTGALLLDKRLKNSMERHTFTGHSHCEDCSKLIEDGYTAMIPIKNEGSAPVIRPSEAIRAGNEIYWFKSPDNRFNGAPVIFIDQETADTLKASAEETPH